MTVRQLGAQDTIDWLMRFLFFIIKVLFISAVEEVVFLLFFVLRFYLRNLIDRLLKILVVHFPCEGSFLLLHGRLCLCMHEWSMLDLVDVQAD